MSDRQLLITTSKPSCRMEDETIEKLSTDDCQAQEDASITTTTSSDITRKYPLDGILRARFIAKWQSPTSSTMIPDVELRAIWKCFLLLLIPTIGYTLSQLYPSSILLHLTFLCFVYGLVDLMEHDPSFSITAPLLKSPKASGKQEFTLEHERRRRVAFVEGTKFYRLPKPMSRKQRHGLHEGRSQHFHDRSIREPTLSVSEPMPTTTASTCLTKVPSPPRATIDWESTNRLLKSIIEQKNIPQRGDSAGTLGLDRLQTFVDLVGNDSTVDVFESALENEDPTKVEEVKTSLSIRSSSSNRMESDDLVAIARLRMAIKPLQEANRLS
jgi:hypothetical protein